MLEKQEDVQKLKDIIGKKFPNLSNEEIEKKATQLLEIGLFLVLLKIRQSSDLVKPSIDKPP